LWDAQPSEAAVLACGFAHDSATRSRMAANGRVMLDGKIVVSVFARCITHRLQEDEKGSPHHRWEACGEGCEAGCRGMRTRRYGARFLRKSCACDA
jgi:hypothetical protein